MSPSQDHVKSLVRGVLYGLIAGDHNHGPQAMGIIVAKQLVQLQQEQLPSNSVDTASSTRVFLDHPHSLLNNIFSDYLIWYHHKHVGWDDTGQIGKLIFSSFPLLKSTNSNNNYFQTQDSVKEQYLEKIIQSAKIDQDLNGQTGGVNPAHRNVILSMFRGWSSMDELLQLAQMETRMTHYSWFAVEVSMLQNYICRRWIESAALSSLDSTNQNEIQMVPPLSIVTICKDFMEQFQNFNNFSQRKSLSKELLTCLKALVENSAFLQGDALEIERLRSQLSRGGFSPLTFQAALYFVILHTHVYALNYQNDQELVEACLNDSFKFAGNANYCPVLVGPMLGARFGDSVFVNLLSHSKRLTEALELSNTLANQWE